MSWIVDPGMSLRMISSFWIVVFFFEDFRSVFFCVFDALGLLFEDPMSPYYTGEVERT